MNAETLEVVIQVVWWATIGAVLGSFIGVVIERVPEGRSIEGRSQCACGRQLRWWENVPVLAWTVLRGRARCCGGKIPAWYTLLELRCAAIVTISMVWVPAHIVARGLIAIVALTLVAFLGVQRRRRQLAAKG